jgi:hypothetical protein
MDMTNAFAAANVVVNPTVVNAEKEPVAPATVTITPESLTAMIQAATQAAVEGLMAQAQTSALVADPVTVPVTGPRQATKPEACSTHRLLTLLDRAISTAIVGARDHVVVPGNLFLVDRATPEVLAVVAAGCLVAASGAGRLSTYLSRLAENVATKSLARNVR